MKNLAYHITALIILFTLSSNAQEDNSLSETIEKGKSDLIEILSQSKEQFNFGITAEEVSKSEPATAIPHKEMSFEGLLKYNQQGISSVLSKTQKLVVPLVLDSIVLTTISVSETDLDKYKVAELINQQFQKELNQLPDDIKNRNFEKVSMAFVPNLNATVYLHNGNSYTSYKGFSMRKALPTEELMNILKEDAVIFQDKYGKMLKEGKLTN